MAVAVGYLNGLIVVKTDLPSFIVTLGRLFILRGLTLGLTRLITGRTQIPGIHELAARRLAGAVLRRPRRRTGLFNWLAGIGADRHAAPTACRACQGIPMSIVWWIVLTAVAAWILLRTRFGNWIFAAGGDANAARNVGVPVARVKIILFIAHRLRGHAAGHDPGARPPARPTRCAACRRSSRRSSPR